MLRSDSFCSTRHRRSHGAAGITEESLRSGPDDRCSSSSSNNDDDDSESIAEIGRNTFTEVSARTDLWNSVIESTWKGQGDAESECEDSSSSSSSSED
mmetsp:Transcript_5297/g.11096  ORF Transcript_5297/g.11096 Transcript_5297/m.11096 type:complete len:98 (-) Transcript_5297:1623-1916(-)